MELVKDFSCPGCKRMCTKNEYIFICNDRLFHQTCNPPAHSISLSYIELAALGEEVLLANCHPNQGATFVVSDCYYLICYDCQISNQYQGFNILATKSTLASTLRSIISQYSQKIPESVLKLWKKSLKKDSTSKKIHNALVESCFYLNANLYCPEHIQYLTEYDLEKFRLACPYCENNSRANLEYIDYILPTCIEKVKELKTPGFSKDFLCTFIEIISNQTTQIDIFVKKKFLLLMNEALTNLSSSEIDSESICLSCHQKFGFGVKQAVQLHETLRHEICIKCFLTKNYSQCIIDREPSVRRIIICKYSRLITSRDKKCNDTEHVCIFDIKNDIVPFKVCCIENSCKISKEHSLVTLGKICQVCNCQVSSTDGMVNEELKKKLEFLEVQCPDHGKIAEYFNKTDPIVKCSLCNDYKTIKIQQNKYSADYSAGVPSIFKKYENDLKKSFVASMINSIYPLIPGQKIYETFWQLESLASGIEISQSLTRVQRFSFLSLSDTINIQEQWIIKSMSKESLKLKIQGVAELHGIIVGNPIDSDMDVTVYVSNITKNMKLQTNVKMTEILFQNPVKIHSDWTEIAISYSGNGKSVIHGFPCGLIQDLKLNESLISVDADEYKMSNGNNAIGGPILGFVFNKIHLNEEEAFLYDSISRSQNGNQILFEVK